MFRYLKFSERLKGSPQKVFALLDKEYSTKNRDALPLLCMEFFDTSFFESLKCSPTEFFGFETKKCRQNRVAIPRPFLCMQIFDTGVFLKHRMVPLGRFLVL